MTPLSEAESRDFWEICEDRYQARSLILTSQMPVAKWHEQIGDPTIAEGILDRIVHHAHRIELRGESLRKNPPKSPERWNVPEISALPRRGQDVPFFPRTPFLAVRRKPPLRSGWPRSPTQT